MNFKILTTLLLVFTALVMFSQERVTGLQINEAVAFEAKKIAVERKSCNCNSENNTVALQLPFFDDFSTTKTFPNQELWDGRSTFVSKDFPYMPTNIGAVTFDAIDSYGEVYSYGTVAPFEADELMTQDIRLDSIFSPVDYKLTPADSVYLSFYYQPQGVGYAPQLRDSLILEFSRYTGELVFSHMDSVTVSTNIYVNPGDTIHALDTLWAPASMGCNPDVYTITYADIVYGDSVRVACDSVIVPEVVWDRIWYSEGLSLDDFKDIYHKDMLQVMIPIVDTSYFIDKFRFRFRNYASLSNENYPASSKSNDDTWNVDYVYLNFNRSAEDTTYRVLTFSQRGPSFLRDYQAMPYRQFKASAGHNMKTNIHMYISNLDNIEHNTKYSYHAKTVGDYGSQFDLNYFGGSCNLKPFYEVGFQICDGCGAAHACPPVQQSFMIDKDVDTLSYIITHYISDSSDNASIVDSVIYAQHLYNYYAYDDGTPEGGWGVDGYERAKVAYKFELSIPDTLRGVQMYFNRTLNNVNEVFFDLLVWSDNSGKPGDIIYRLENQKVKWENGLYSFYTYLLDEPLLLTGTFYVGWERKGQYKLNIGFDANNDERSNIFHMEYNEWSNATYAGALLVRPIVGVDMVLSQNEIASESGIRKIKVYPNPASTYFSISNSELTNNIEAELRLYNMFGAEVLEQKGLSSKVNISHIPNGIYIVKIISKNKQYSAKLLINR